MASGTTRTGFVKSDLGPFKCMNCHHFEMRGACNEKAVMRDPDVAKNKDGTAAVRPDDCCNEFDSLMEAKGRKHMLMVMLGGKR